MIKMINSLISSLNVTNAGSLKTTNCDTLRGPFPQAEFLPGGCTNCCHLLMWCTVSPARKIAFPGIRKHHCCNWFLSEVYAEVYGISQLLMVFVLVPLSHLWWSVDRIIRRRHQSEWWRFRRGGWNASRDGRTTPPAWAWAPPTGEAGGANTPARDAVVPRAPPTTDRLACWGSDEISRGETGERRVRKHLG